MREMILADNLGAANRARQAAPLSTRGFLWNLQGIERLPATIRFLDPPLHEFLPNSKESQADLARKLNIPVEKSCSVSTNCTNSNPMLGFRGCRLGIKYPRSPPCRPAPFSRPPPMRPSKASRRSPRS